MGSQKSNTTHNLETGLIHGWEYFPFKNILLRELIARALKENCS